MLRGIFKTTTFAVVAAVAGAGTAQAGGLERDSQDFDILYLDGTQTRAGMTFVMPDRKLKDIRGSAAAAATGGINPITGRPYETSADETESYFVPRFSAKFDLMDDLACAGQYRTPWGAHTDVGIDTPIALSAIDQEITSTDIGLNCSYKFAVGSGSYLRLLGGLSYQHIHGEQTRLLLPGTLQAINPLLPAVFEAPSDPSFALGGRIGSLDVEDDSYGWRAGLAYEIPEIAFRAQLVYQSEVDYSLDGTVDNLFAVPVPIHGEATLPQSVELKVQSGIAQNWLAFGSVKWVDWSTEQAVNFYSSAPIFGVVPTGTRITGLDLYYRDGWTIGGGLGHKINDRLSVAGSLTWDRGTTTGLSSQTDTWTFGLGGAYHATENFEIRLGGALGVYTSGTKDDRFVNGKFKPTGSVADFDDDLISALSVSAKVKF